MRRFIFTLFLFILLLPISIAQAQSAPVLISIFEREDCVHCQVLLAFIEEYKKEENDIQVAYYDIYSSDSRALYDAFTEEFELQKATPIVLVGDTILVGFDSVETTGERIKDLVREYKGKQSFTPQEYIQLKKGEPLRGFAGAFCDDSSTVCAANVYFNIHHLLHD